MNSKHSTRLLQGIGWGVAILGLAVVGYVTFTSASPGTSTPTQQPGAAAQAGYPGPLLDGTPTSLPFFPTMPGGAPNPLLSAYATPSPDEKVAVVAVSELSAAAAVQPTPTNGFKGSYPTVESGKTRIGVLYVTDPSTGQSVRLGDDTSSATPGAMTDKFVIWYTGGTKDLKKGLYLYRFATKENVWIDDGVYVQQSAFKISGRWVLYGKPGEKGRMLLYAYNVDTSQATLIAKDVVRSRGGIIDTVAINEDMVAWIGWDFDPKSYLTLNVYDLLNQKKQPLPAYAPTNGAAQLSVSRDLVVWYDWYWKGYDLAENAAFTVPILPPGVDRSAITGIGRPVTAHGKTLQWTLQIDGKERYFAASIANKTPGTVLQPAVTLLSPATVSTPEVVTAPTSYP